MSDQASALYAFRQGRERRCLVDAIAYLRRKHRISGDGTGWYIYEVIRPQQYRPLPVSARSNCAESQLRDRLMAFNDTRCKNFDDLRAVLIKARIRAVREFCHAAAQPSVEQAEIAAAKAAAARKEEATAAHKRQLLAELARERMVRHAAGDKRKTYILTPRTPEPSIPDRLAA
jgi:hypothetical protein